MKHTAILFFLGVVINLYLCAADYSMDAQESCSKNTHKLRCSPPQIHGGKAESSFKTKSREYAHSRFPYPSFLEREDSGIGQELITISEEFICAWCGEMYKQELLLDHDRVTCNQRILSNLKKTQENGSMSIRRSYKEPSNLRQYDEASMGCEVYNTNQN